jgi:hypothetical protein
MRVEKDFEELLELFNKHKVKYCIVGAYAVGFHGYPRYTKDMDILIEPSLRNGRKITQALHEFGFGSLDLNPADFIREGAIIQLGYEPVRVDIINSIKGVSLKQIWENKAAGHYGKQRVFFIGLQDLIKGKKMVKRRQDLADLERLSARSKS